MGFCGNVSFHSPERNVQECRCWVKWWLKFPFLKKLPDCFPDWSYHLLSRVTQSIHGLQFGDVTLLFHFSHSDMRAVPSDSI